MTLTDLAVITLVIAGAVVLAHGIHYVYIAYRMRTLSAPWVLMYSQRPFWNTSVEFFVVLMVTASLYLVSAEGLHLQP